MMGRGVGRRLAQAPLARPCWSATPEGAPPAQRAGHSSCQLAGSSPPGWHSSSGMPRPVASASGGGWPATLAPPSSPTTFQTRLPLHSWRPSTWRKTRPGHSFAPRAGARPSGLDCADSLCTLPCALVSLTNTSGLLTWGAAFDSIGPWLKCMRQAVCGASSSGLNRWWRTWCTHNDVGLYLLQSLWACSIKNASWLMALLCRFEQRDITWPWKLLAQDAAAPTQLPASSYATSQAVIPARPGLLPAGQRQICCFCPRLATQCNPFVSLLNNMRCNATLSALALTSLPAQAILPWCAQ